MRSFFKWAGIILLPALFVTMAGLPISTATTDGMSLLPAIALATVTLGNYNETFFAQEALIQLEKALGMAGRVHRGYEPTTKAKGNTISIRRPSTFTATDAPASDSDVDTESVNLVVDQHKEVKFAITDKDLSLSADQIITDHIRPAAYALADKIDQSLAALYLDIPWVAAQTATPALADILAIQKIMFDNKVPMTEDGNLHYMIDGATKLAYLTALSAAGQQANTQDPSLRRGSMGMLYGFDVFANQNTPTHTSGVAADAVGAVDFGSGTTAVYAKGATAMHVDGLTSGATLKKGDTFAISGDPQRYVLTADGTNESTGDIDIAFAPPLKQAVDEDTVVTFTITGSAKVQTIAFHRNAFALGIAPLSTMGDGLGARISTAEDPITGLSLRSRIFYMADESKIKVALDVLYGVKTLDPNLAVRGYDT